MSHVRTPVVPHSARGRADTTPPPDHHPQDRSREADEDGLGCCRKRVRTPRVRAARAANRELLRLYWSIGRDILDRQDQAAWGGKVIDRLAADLRDAFPDLRGFSRRNRHYMRSVVEAWPTEADFVQSPSARLTWSHVTTLVTRLDDPQLRTWYAVQAVRQHWSRNVLEHRIARRLHARVGAAPSNVTATLPPPDSDLAQSRPAPPTSSTTSG
ncbi:DUF1016 N-terminal domain-containing protein [Kineococcus sp. SYSU DK002]|uniref:DUF1016 N-terminal domain-containing protein n=1 Tax=Kineococcus sp. SYSU DK002 TaxID=3383123 RepID=UPI003D7D8390